MNTVASSTSFREDQSWLPICLPRFNASGFLYAHISLVMPELYLILLSPKADGFAAASECRQHVVERLEHEGELRAQLVEAIERPQYSVADLGVPHVCHCLYRIPGSAGGGVDMFTAPRTGRLAGLQSPYHDLRSLKRLLRHYMLAHARVPRVREAKPVRQDTNDERCRLGGRRRAVRRVLAARVNTLPTPLATACTASSESQPSLFMSHRANIL